VREASRRKRAVSPRPPARSVADRSRKGAMVARLSPVWAIPSVVAAAFIVACGGTSSPTTTRYFEFTFTQYHPAGAPPDIVRVYASVNNVAEIQQLRSVVRLTSGAMVTETAWANLRPERQVVRNWTTCVQNAQKPPEAIPKTISALEASVLGPAKPPPGATVLSLGTWRIWQGVAAVTVHQFGPSIVDRSVSVGLPNLTPGTVIADASLRRISAMPGMLPDWRACRK